jgi:hypothetical protein
MPNKTMKIRRRKAPRRKKEPDILERLKKLSDNAPVVKLRGGSFAFYDDQGDIESREK